MIALLFTILLNLYAHAIYISVTEIEDTGLEGALHLRVKVFTDDLEDGIYYATERSVKLRTREDLEKNESLVEAYIVEHLTVSINETKNPMDLLRVENEGDATWSYWRMPVKGDIRSIEVENSILIELFDTQSNVVSVNINEEKRYLRFSKSVTRDKIKF